MIFFFKSLLHLARVVAAESANPEVVGEDKRGIHLHVLVAVLVRVADRPEFKYFKIQPRNGKFIKYMKRIN